MRQLALITTLLLLLSAALCQELLVTNPGFEQAAVGGEVPGWLHPAEWSGKLTLTTAPGQVHSGRQAAQLAAALCAGKWWGRMQSVPIPVEFGQRYRFSVWVKRASSQNGGAVKLGISNDAQHGDKVGCLYTWQEQPLALGDQWQQVAMEMQPLDPQVQKVALMIEVEGKDAVTSLDDVDFAVVN